MYHRIPLRDRIGRLSALLIVVLVLACAKEPIENAIVTHPEAYRGQLLIAGVASDFKENVITRIINRYGDKYAIRLSSFDELDNIDYSDYDIILLVDEVQAWMLFNRKFKRVMKDISEREKVVIFITAGNPDWEYDYDGLDAITSASDIVEEERVLEAITRKIDGILNAK